MLGLCHIYSQAFLQESKNNLSPATSHIVQHDSLLGNEAGRQYYCCLCAALVQCCSLSSSKTWTTSNSAGKMHTCVSFEERCFALGLCSRGCHAGAMLTTSWAPASLHLPKQAKGHQNTWTQHGSREQTFFSDPLSHEPYRSRLYWQQGSLW